MVHHGVHVKRMSLGRDLFRIQSNIYHEAFFANIVNGISRYIFSQESYLASIRLCSKYASAGNSKHVENE